MSVSLVSSDAPVLSASSEFTGAAIVRLLLSRHGILFSLCFASTTTIASRRWFLRMPDSMTTTQNSALDDTLCFSHAFSLLLPVCTVFVFFSSFFKGRIMEEVGIEKGTVVFGVLELCTWRRFSRQSFRFLFRFFSRNMSFARLW